MILSVLLTLIAIGTLASGALYIAKAAPVYSGIASLTIWLVIGYSATSIDLIHEGQLQEAAASEPALAFLAYGNAAISAIALLAAVIGTGPYADSDVYGAGDVPSR